MKTKTGIWIDGTKALVISLNNGSEMIREIAANIENHVHHNQHQGDKGTFMGGHHLNHEEKFQQRHLHQENDFLNQVIAEASTADELFIMGSANMKYKLKNKIEENKILKSKFKGVVVTDHLTLNQCVAKVKDFYRS